MIAVIPVIMLKNMSTYRNLYPSFEPFVYSLCLCLVDKAPEISIGLSVLGEYKDSKFHTDFRESSLVKNICWGGLQNFLL